MKTKEEYDAIEEKMPKLLKEIAEKLYTCKPFNGYIPTRWNKLSYWGRERYYSKANDIWPIVKAHIDAERDKVIAALADCNMGRISRERCAEILGMNVLEFMEKY